MSICVTAGVGLIQNRVVFKPVALVNHVILGVGWVASVEVYKEAAVLECGRVCFQRVLHVDTDESPF